MDKLKAVFFTAAVAYAFGSMVLLKAQQEEIDKIKKDLAKYRRYHERMVPWSKTMVDVFNEHVKNGGDLRLSAETMNTLDAYLIFARNDMV